MSDIDVYGDTERTECEHGNMIAWDYGGCQECQENFRKKMKSIHINPGPHAE